MVWCWERISSTLVFRASRTRAVLVKTSMPSCTVLLQAVTRRSMPFTSTTQTRQAAISLISFKKHKVGTGMPILLVASRIVVPSGTEMGCLLIVKFTILLFALL